MTEIKSVEIDAELRQIKTMADGTVNITLNLPEYCIEQSKIMLGWRGEQVRAVISIVKETPNKSNNDEKEQSTY